MKSVWLICILLVPVFVWSQKKQITVSLDGKGDFSTIQSAINSLKDRSAERQIIFVKNGTYHEKLVVPVSKTKVSLIGESKDAIIEFDDHVGKGDIKTSTSYTVLIQGNDFYAENITFTNTAGREAHQAVALHVEADRCVFRNCNIVGNQDTLYAGVGGSRHYYIDCTIVGTTDFIFGPATAVFENCKIECNKNSYITAASTQQEQRFGFVFIRCTITRGQEGTQVYLGRPWRPFARTVFIQCDLGDHILPEGWHNWSKPDAEKTSFYGEYQSKGPGGNPAARVSWSHQLTDQEVKEYTLENILAGWGGKVAQ